MADRRTDEVRSDKSSYLESNSYTVHFHEGHNSYEVPNRMVLGFIKPQKPVKIGYAPDGGVPHKNDIRLVFIAHLAVPFYGRFRMFLRLRQIDF